MTEAGPTGYPDEETYTVTLVGFDPLCKRSVIRIIRDSGTPLSEVREIVQNLPWVLYDPWVPGEDPSRDEVVEFLKEFGGILEITHWPPNEQLSLV